MDDRVSLPLIVLFACLVASVAQAREQPSIWQTPSTGSKEAVRQRPTIPLRQDFAQAPAVAFPGTSEFGLSGRERAQLRDQIRNAAHDIYTQERESEVAPTSEPQP